MKCEGCDSPILNASRRTQRFCGKECYLKTWRRENSTRIVSLRKIYYRDNRERQLLASRRSEVRRKYGISLEEYDSLFAKQGGKCAVCAFVPAARRLVVDHDHANAIVRGLLCDKCNLALGLLGDSPELIRTLAHYAERSKSGR